MKVIQDHPSWTRTADGGYRVVRVGLAAWLLRVSPDDNLTLRRLRGGEHEDRPPVVDVVDATTLDHARGGAPAELWAALAALGPVTRVRNPDLWDAVCTGVVRQVVRAAQARELYRRLCAAYGEAIPTPYGPVTVLPTAETVVCLDERELRALGLGFKAPALRAAARAYLDAADRWAGLAPADLVIALQHVPRIGPWTAGAAAADATNEFSIYPYADLAVRTWAARAAPSVAWPAGEADFGAYWRTIAGASLSALTLLALAWGDWHGSRSS